MLKKRLISQATLVIFGQRRKAMQSAYVEEHKRHDGPRRRSLWHNKQKWMEQVESTAKNNLCVARIMLHNRRNG